MNPWHDFRDERISAENFVSVIEITKGSKKKYELDKETGYIMLDRILYTSTRYPANYGFIPRTYGDDNDPLDVLILCSESLIPMSLVKCYPIGVIIMNDNGSVDEKIIAIPFNDPNYNHYKSIHDLPPHIFDEMKHFFQVYKNLENKAASCPLCGCFSASFKASSVIRSLYKSSLDGSLQSRHVKFVFMLSSSFDSSKMPIYLCVSLNNRILVTVPYWPGIMSPPGRT